MRTRRSVLGCWWLPWWCPRVFSVLRTPKRCAQSFCLQTSVTAATAAMITAFTLHPRRVQNLWRAHELEAPAYCSMDTPQNECHMICSSNISDSMMSKLFVDRPTFGDWSASDNLDDDRRRAVVEKLCTTPWSPGEQMESASPSDISFWPIHPTVDRLLQYRRIVRPFNDSSWVTDDTLGGAKACQYSRYGCDGHHAYDLTVSPTRVADPTACCWAARPAGHMHLEGPNATTAVCAWTAQGAPPGT